MIRSLADVNQAFAEGRYHLQRIVKGVSGSFAMDWLDWSFASGQPAYDARIGSPCQFTPVIAQRNDSVFFPQPLPGDQHRYLAEINLRPLHSAYHGPESVIIYDLLGYYPLIDGDSSEPQEMSPTVLPRYADGDGVQAVIMNTIAPATAASRFDLTYIDADGTERTASNLNLIVRYMNSSTGYGPESASAIGCLWLPLYRKGVRAIKRLTHVTVPGGMHVIYLVKPLATMTLGDFALSGEKSLLPNMPRISDGACLGWFSRNCSSSARTVGWFGHFTFVWG